MVAKQKNIRFDRFVLVQTIILAIGSFIGWREVISEINYYCTATGLGIGGLTSFSGTLTTNPILTPCFWGSIAFAITLIWSIMILLNKSNKYQFKNMKNMFWLLLGSTIFAVVNTAYTFYKYFTQTTGSPNFGCSLDRIENPFTTACFMGATAFLLAFITNYLYKHKNQKK